MANLCYTCGSCDNECPINRRSNQLFPRRIVRAYVLGLSAEASGYPEIWYCVKCGRCSAVCPMGVKPFEVISKLQDMASRSEPERLRNFLFISYRMHQKLQKARCLILRGLFKKDLKKSSGLTPLEAWKEADGWDPKEMEGDGLLTRVPHNRLRLEQKFMKYFEFSTNIRRCISCGSCTNACPASTGSTVFSPMKIFRMAKWGMVGEATVEPGIWLCIDCGRCISVCPQGVRGAWILRILRELAVSNGVIGKESLNLWKTMDLELYKIYHENIKIALKEGGSSNPS
ncbi:MAG: 4Fe-4S dicluster domain-containing protein [Syntrophobacterales bacterium]|nr:4Fe-4S dicluster domain-containing protein [Syntrophobacterales bacterium]